MKIVQLCNNNIAITLLNFCLIISLHAVGVELTLRIINGVFLHQLA